MEQNSNAVRRTLGIVCLVVPAGMILLGQTVLRSSLRGAGFLLYWLVCFLFTFAAVSVALVELRSVRRQTRKETRELLQRTLLDIEGKNPATPPAPDDFR